MSKTRFDRLREQHDTWAESLGLASFDSLVGTSDRQVHSVRRAAAQAELEAALHQGQLPPLTQRARIKREDGASLYDQISAYQNPDGDGRAHSWAEERELRREYEPLVESFALGEFDPADPLARHGSDFGTEPQGQHKQNPSQVTQLPPNAKQMAERMQTEFSEAYGEQDEALLSKTAEKVVREFGLNASQVWEHRQAVYGEIAKRMGVKEGGDAASDAQLSDSGRTELAMGGGSHGQAEAEDMGSALHSDLSALQKKLGIY